MPPESERIKARPRPQGSLGPITDEEPAPSRGWLEHLPEHTRSMASNWFLQAIRQQGARTPREVCRAVHGQGRERFAQHSEPKVGAILDALLSDRQGALAFAAERLAWEALSHEERMRIKQQRSAAHVAVWRASQRSGRTPVEGT